MGAGVATILAVVLAASTGEHGEAHAAAEHAMNWSDKHVLFELASTITNFVIMAAFLVYALKQPLATFLKTRRENMAKALEEAREKQVIAEKRIAEYKSRLDNLENEVERIVKSYEREAEADRERMRQDADRAIERITREAEFTIRQEIRKAEKAIREAAANATLEAAEQLVRERMSGDDQRRLADNYIASLDAQVGRA